MKLHSILLATASVLVLSTLAFALEELKVQADAENVVAARIVGTWKLDAALTRQLDPDRKAGEIASLTFFDNPGVLPGMQAASDRFKNRQIFGAGILNVDGATQTHTYVLVNHHGNMELVWFTTKENDAIGIVTTKTVHIAVARDKAKDLLFLGGESMRDASEAFDRAAAEDKKDEKKK